MSLRVGFRVSRQRKKGEDRKASPFFGQGRKLEVERITICPTLPPGSFVVEVSRYAVSGPVTGQTATK